MEEGEGKSRSVSVLTIETKAGASGAELVPIVKVDAGSQCVIEYTMMLMARG